MHDDARGSFIRFSNDFDAPSVNTDRLDAVRIAFDAGYGAADAVPQAIKQAILMIVAHWYEHRETVVVGTGAVDIPLGANALLSPFRRVGL